MQGYVKNISLFLYPFVKRDVLSEKTYLYRKYVLMDLLSPETLHFIKEHRMDDVRKLALQSGKYPLVDISEAVVQIAGWQIACKKIPSWARTEGIIYPPHLSMEQCSSEITACYKALLVHGDTFTDLTAGLGVDCSFIGKKFQKVYYVEQQDNLCRLARHNFPLLGLGHIQIRQADGVEYLKGMDPVDCLFLDPARRDIYGGKTVAISECEPDVCALEPLLVEKGRTVMIKLSPMLDLFSALRELKHVCEVHVIAVNNECKELVVILRKVSPEVLERGNEVVISCEQIVDNSLTTPFRFTMKEEKDATCVLADCVESFLYEPGVALLKAAPYRLLSERYAVKKLHSNSHLYTSETLVDFPGRRFNVIGVSGFGKRELRAFLEGVDKANLTVRNFPATVAELRKKLKLKEGGDLYLFATTLVSGDRVLIKCRKA